MKNRRSIVFLLAGTFLLVFANFILPDMDASRSRIMARTTLLPRIESVSEIAIETSGQPTVRLQKTDVWRLSAPFQGAVDNPLVMRLLDTLAQENMRDSLSQADLLRQGKSAAFFGLDTPQSRISLTDENGEQTRVIFGNRTPSQRLVYAAVEGEDFVMCVSTGLYALATMSADGFRHRAVVDAGIGSVVKMSVKRPVGELLRLERIGERWWIGDDRQASVVKVRELLEGVVAAQALDFRWPEGATNESESASSSLLSAYGLDADNAVTLVLTGDDGANRWVSFGKSASEKTVYALVQNGMAIVTVDAALKALVEQEPSLFADARLFPSEASAVSSFSLSFEGLTCVLSRAQAGAWRLEAPVVATANAAAANEILGRILSLTSSDVQSSGLQVEIDGKGFRVESRMVLGQLRMEDLRSKEIVEIDPKRIRRLVRTTSGLRGRTIAAVYDSERKTWNLERASEEDQGGVVLADEVNHLVAALNPLLSREVVALKVSAAELAQYGLEHPFLTLAVDQEGVEAVRKNILVGGKARGGRYATVGSSEAIFVIPDKTVGLLLAPLLSR